LWAAKGLRAQFVDAVEIASRNKGPFSLYPPELVIWLSDRELGVLAAEARGAYLTNRQATCDNSLTFREVEMSPVPRPPEFRTVKQLYRRLTSMDEGDRISVEPEDLPPWQRQLVWNEEDQGMLALSILNSYPIGLIVLWKRTNGVRVPIDGRQRLTAIKNFVEGVIAIPREIGGVPQQFQGAKYKLRDGDDPAEARQLGNVFKDAFDDYELTIVQYETDAPEDFVRDVFVKLQGGKRLSKTEIRAALGGRVCDLVTELTGPATTVGEQEEEEEEEREATEPQTAGRHQFFDDLKMNGFKNTRKAHRNICDVLLHEFLNPGDDKHWSSLEKMYREKAGSLTESEGEGFRDSLSRFRKACLVQRGHDMRLSPVVRSAFFILSIYRAWRALVDTYAMPAAYRFIADIEEFESQRQEHRDELPWVRFTSALSNAGYARNRIDTRHEILMSYLMQQNPGLVAKDGTRLFTTDQKIAIWTRANGRCQWVENGMRCQEAFLNWREADADHIVRWTNGGRTSLDNGRLLCTLHNRTPRPS